jgi:hypothetical protein
VIPLKAKRLFLLVMGAILGYLAGKYISDVEITEKDKK